MGGLGQVVPVRGKKKIDFWKTRRGEEGQSGRTFPPQRPCNSTWTRGDTRHQGVNLDFQRRVMNYESSRNLPTGKYDVISGNIVGCGRPAWRKEGASNSLLFSTDKVFIFRLQWACVFLVCISRRRRPMNHNLYYKFNTVKVCP